MPQHGGQYQSAGVDGRWIALAIIGLALLLNHADRLVLAILLEPIKAELQLSDGELGLLTGPAFSLVYAAMVLPIAWLAERRSRVAIVTISILVWSGATAACGLAGGFMALLIARMAVGSGEAGGIAPSMSLVSDLFPADQRATAMSLFGMGASAGVLIAPLIGGLLLSEVGWRWTFVIMGCVGLPIALALFYGVREPRRGAIDGLSSGPSSVSWTSSLARLLRRRSYVLLVSSFILITLAQSAMLLWLPAFFERSHGLTGAELGGRLSLFQGLPLLLGTIFGGVLADRLARRDERWFVWMPMIAAFVAAPCTLGVFTASTENTAFALLALPYFVQGLSLGPSYALLQNLAAVHSRATSTAVLAFVVTVFGASLGPLLLGLLSETLSARFGEQSLRYAFFAIIPPYLAAGLLFFVMSFFLKRDLEDARFDSEQSSLISREPASARQN